VHCDTVACSLLSFQFISVGLYAPLVSVCTCCYLQPLFASIDSQHWWTCISTCVDDDYLLASSITQVTG